LKVRSPTQNGLLLCAEARERFAGGWKAPLPSISR